MLPQQRGHHDGEFASLRLVDCDCVCMEEFLAVVGAVDHGLAVESDPEGVLFTVHGDDTTHVPVEDPVVVVVLDLHDPVPEPEDPCLIASCEGEFGLFRGWRVEDLLEPAVQRNRPALPFSHGRKHLYVLHWIVSEELRDSLGAELHQEILASLRVVVLVEVELPRGALWRIGQAWDMPLVQLVGAGDDPAAACLAVDAP